jgi:microcystin-dependent protein
MALDLTYDLANFTPADANPLQANFTRLVQYINQEVITRDGATAMTGQLRLVGNPVAPLDAATKQMVDLILPIGVILPFGGDAAAVPGGGQWALADGATLPTVDYSALFNVIGYRYDPTLTNTGSFKLPNLSDRVPIGASGTIPLGTSGGRKDSIVPSHGHSVSVASGATDTTTIDTNHLHDLQGHVHSVSNAPAGGHSHNIGAAQLYYVEPGQNEGFTPSGSAGRSATYQSQPDHTHVIGVGGASPNNTGWMDRNNSHKHTVTISATGSAATVGEAVTNANLPPYTAVNWIVRIK